MPRQVGGTEPFPRGQGGRCQRRRGAAARFAYTKQSVGVALAMPRSVPGRAPGEAGGGRSQLPLAPAEPGTPTGTGNLGARLHRGSHQCLFLSWLRFHERQLQAGCGSASLSRTPRGCTFAGRFVTNVSRVAGEE